MKNKNMIIALLAGGLALATAHSTAQSPEELPPVPPHKGQPPPGQSSQDPKESGPAAAPAGRLDLKASSIIGLSVFTDSGQRLGKVKDLIVNLACGSVPFAIVEYGGALGIGQTHVAVPLPDFKWSGESRQLILATTRARFEGASSAPTGGWMAVAGEDCLKNVDQFYGDPSVTSSRFERQEASGMSSGHEPVRHAMDPKGSSHLSDEPSAITPGADNALGKPAEEDLTAKVNGLIRQDAGEQGGLIQVSIASGVVTLNGFIASEATKKTLTRQILALPGVARVEDKLTTGNE